MKSASLFLVVLLLAALRYSWACVSNPISGFFGDSKDGSNGTQYSFLIFPGTKWCGAGSNAVNDDDLGVEQETDKCCRQHDKCPDLILAGESKYGLTNDASYTRLNCNCDSEFRDCLRKANTEISKAVGVTYFDALNTQCFREDYPIIKCARNSLIIPTKCLRYEVDQTLPKKWQWFDVPTYKYEI